MEYILFLKYFLWYFFFEYLFEYFRMVPECPLYSNSYDTWTPSSLNEKSEIPFLRVHTMFEQIQPCTA